MSRRQTIGRRSNGAQQAVRRVQRNINGGQTRPSPDPTSIVKVPWYNLQVQFQMSAGDDAKNISVGFLRQKLSEQVYLPGDTHFELRINHINGWGVPVSDKVLQLAVYDLADLDIDEAEPIGVFEDYGSGASRSRLGYAWPSSQARQVLVTDKHDKSLIAQFIGVSVIRVGLSWRPRVTGSRRLQVPE